MNTPMKRIVLDVETTGLFPYKHAVIQVGAMIIDEFDEPIATFNKKCQPHPGAEIEDKALEVNNITRAELSTFEPAIEVVAQFAEFMGTFVNPKDKFDKMYAVGFNSDTFDLPFLRKFFSNSSNKYFGSYIHMRSIDVMHAAYWYCLHTPDKPRPENYKLKTLIDFFEIPYEDDKLHDALYDVEKTLELYNTIKGLTIRP